MATPRIRWRIAYALNLLPRACWADLVSWALGSMSLRDALTANDECRADASTHRDHNCYCNKIRRCPIAGPLP